jgi:cell division protein FtsN
MVPAVKQSQPSEKVSQGRTKVPAGSKPIEAVADKPKIPAMPLAVKQSQPDEKILESSTVYAVHAGSFYTASQANLLLNKLKSLGFPSFMYSSLSKKGNSVQVVVAGKYPSYDLAKEASRSLSNKGHSNFIARAKESLKIPEDSAPIEAVADKPKIPAKPLAVKQSQPAEKIPENSTVYAVHAGSFYTASQANLLLDNLESLGFPSFGYSSISKKGNTVYVVVAGKYQSYDLAKEASRSLSKKGHSNFIAKAKDSLKEGPAK